MAWPIRTSYAEIKPASWFLANALNPALHPQEQQGYLAGSLDELGWVKPVIVNKRTDPAWGADRGVETLLDGHARLREALRAGDETPVPLDWVDLPPHLERIALAVLDQMIIYRALDKEHLALLMQDTKPSNTALQRMCAAMCEEVGIFPNGTGLEPVEDVEPQLARAAELQEQWGTALGQLWEIGQHRLLCGDATKAQDVERLLRGVQPWLMVTDPPYGVNYEPEWRNKAAAKGQLSYARRRVGQVTNDDRSDWSEAWRLFPGDVAYTWSPGGDHVITTGSALLAAEFQIRTQIIWRKPPFPISRGHYTYQHEPCWYAVKKNRTAHWQGDATASTVWEIALDRNVAGGHSTQKPLECMARPIRNHLGDVYDPFVGSGTTIVAAERLARRCFALDVDPGYIAVTLQRLQDMGLEAKLVAS